MKMKKSQVSGREADRDRLAREGEGQMNRRKSGVTDDRGKANLTSFSSEETPTRFAAPVANERERALARGHGNPRDSTEITLIE